MEIKQYIVINSSLEMPAGKLAAQVAHASMGCILSLCEKSNTAYTLSFNKESPLDIWLNGSFTKIVLYVKSEEKLLALYEKVKESGVPNALIKDAGRTFFDKPTYTCLGIGPDLPEKLKPLIGKLQVFQK